MIRAGEIRPGADEYLPYYHRYVSLVPDGDVLVSLVSQLGSVTALLRGVPDSKEGYRYQPDKWSIRELVGHVIDTERVFSYRALRFGRNDQLALEGFDQDVFVNNASFESVPLEGLIEELESVRKSTILLFRNLEPKAWERRGVASGGEVSVRALAWMTAGHSIYHEEILRTRYGCA